MDAIMSGLYLPQAEEYLFKNDRASPAPFFPPHNPILSPLCKVTLVYYLNPEWPSGNGGQLRLYSRSGAYGQEEGFKNTSRGEGTEVDGGEEGHVDVWPEGDTLVMFLSEELEHEVLPNWSEEEKDHRWTYTLWLVEEGGCEGES